MMSANARTAGRTTSLLVCALILGMIAGWQRLYHAAPAELPSNAYYTVKRGDMLVSVVEDGALKAANELTIRNDLEGESRIITLVPEGSYVRQGELLAELDASLVKEKINTQAVAYEESLFTYLQAEGNLKIRKSLIESNIKAAELEIELAQTDLEKYRDGDAPQEVRTAEARIGIQEEDLRTNAERHARTQELFAQGHATKNDLEADTLSLKYRETQLDQSRESLRLLKKYTIPNTIRAYEANLEKAKEELVRSKIRSASELAQAEADLRTAKNAVDVMQETLERQKKQMEYTKIYAPQEGFVLYASTSPYSQRGGRSPDGRRGRYSSSYGGDSRGRGRGDGRDRGSRGSSASSSGGESGSYGAGSSSFGSIGSSAITSGAQSSGMSLSSSELSTSGSMASSTIGGSTAGSATSFGSGSSGSGSRSSTSSMSSGGRSGSSGGFSSGSRTSSGSVRVSTTPIRSSRSSSAASSLGASSSLGSSSIGSSIGSSASGVSSSLSSTYGTGSGSLGITPTVSSSSSFSSSSESFSSWSTVIEEGATVRERQELLKIPDLSQILAEVKVPEARVRQLRPGMPAFVKVESMPDRRFVGRVRKVALLPDAQTSWMNPDLKLYSTEVLLEGELSELRPGVSARAEIIVTNLQQVLRVPLQSVTALRGGHVCYVAQGQTAAPVPVTTGWYNDQFIQITSGLNEGDRVLLAPPAQTLQAADEELAETESEQPPSGVDAAAASPNGSGRVRGGGFQ